MLPSRPVAVTLQRVDCFHESLGVLAILPLEEDLSGELLADERAPLGRFGPSRRRTYAGGRVALRAALAALGAPELAILSDERGAPVLPAGYSGSIAHKDTLAVALAVASAPGTFVGVDVEDAEPLRVDVSRHVLTDEEQRTHAGLEERERLRVLRVTFAVKEAIYKAIAPVCRRYVGFREVAVAIGLAPEHPSRRDAELRCDFDPPSPLPLAVRARWAELDPMPGISWGALIAIATARTRG